MRLVLTNPHYWAYGKSVVNVLLRRRHHIKYDYFLEYYLKDKSKKTAMYIDGAKTSFTAIGIKFLIFPKLFVRLEIFCWMLVNKINPFKQQIYFDLEKLDAKNDILVDFARSADAKKSSNKKYQFKGIQLLLFTHYFLKVNEISDYIQTVPHPIVAAENDLSNNSYFRKFFPLISEVYQLPLGFGERFVPRTEFSKRLNKCFAIGTICPVEKSNDEYISYFGIDILHPMRREIYDKQQLFTQEIDCYIRSYKGFSLIRENDPKDTTFMRFMKKFGPSVLLKMLLVRQHNQYFTFDIVEKYNTYKMFVSPEETIGLPSINVFEGMACGSAFIGIIHPMYTNLGLVPGIHYIGYQENDFDDMIAKIRYYQGNPEELERIADTGCRFVTVHLNKKAIADTLWNDLEVFSKQFSAQGTLNMKCSFRKNIS